MKLTTFQNKDYKPGVNVLKRLFWYVVNALVFNSYLFPSYYVKVKLLRLFGAKVGSGVIIKPKVNIKYPWRLIIGNDVWIGEKVWVDNLLPTVGPCKSVGPRVSHDAGGGDIGPKRRVDSVYPIFLISNIFRP